MEKEKDIVLEENKEENETTNLKKSVKDKLKKKDDEIETLKKEVDKWKNEFYRAYADTQNLRNSLEKEHRQAMKYRAEGFIDKLLPVIDGFNLALANSPSDPAVKNYLIGFEFIYRNFLQALESEGVKEIKPTIGDKFDSSIMNALDVEETDGEPNRVTKVYSVGIKLHDRMVRHANVIVSKQKEEKNENSSLDEKEEA